MYQVDYYFFNSKRSKICNTLEEAFNFWRGLPFETFRELYKI